MMRKSSTIPMGWRCRRPILANLADELAARGLTANALALKLRVPANRITDIVRGRRALTAETALRLGRYFGTGAKFWIDLQSSYDLAVAERDLGAVIEREIDPGVKAFSRQRVERCHN